MVLGALSLPLLPIEEAVDETGSKFVLQSNPKAPFETTQNQTQEQPKMADASLILQGEEQQNIL